MKSRISFFNGGVFRKNITRFAPAWVLYAVLTLLLMLAMGGGDGVRFAAGLADMTHMTAFFALVWAFLNVQLLFGDLFSSRICNALHAMPIRRETWFFTNALTGLAFWAVPNAGFTLIFRLISGGGWQAPLLWFAAGLGQYLFFFGIAVLSAYCVGRRFAMALVYAILNFLSLILYWLVYNLYEPLLYGIKIPEDIFLTLCPAVQLIGNDYFQIDYTHLYDKAVFRELALGTGWGYLGICALIGLGALALALVLYRRRKLECAGDFMAVRRLSPVFLILYTFSVVVLSHTFYTLFWGVENYVFMALGLIIGFFTGLMLLQRTVRVFRKKTFLAFGVLAAVFSLTLVLTALDPLGVTRWVPEADQVKNVRISTGSGYYEIGECPELEQAENIEKILGIHETCLEKRGALPGTEPVYMEITLRYELKNGLTRQRNYEVYLQQTELTPLRELLTLPEVVLGSLYTNPDAQTLVRMDLDGENLFWTEESEMDSLLEAVVMDCEAGNMAQDWAFTRNARYIGWITVEARLPNGIYHSREVRFHDGCTNILAWLEETAGWKPEHSDKYGY